MAVCVRSCVWAVPRDTSTPGGQLPFLLASSSQHPAQGLGESQCLLVGATTRVLAQRKPAGESGHWTWGQARWWGGL